MRRPGGLAGPNSIVTAELTVAALAARYGTPGVAQLALACDLIDRLLCSYSSVLGIVMFSCLENILWQVELL